MLANRVREVTLTVGTGDLTLDGPLAGHIAFVDAFAIGDSVTYVIEDGDDYEIGTGTITATGGLERTVVSETLVAGTYTTAGATPISLTGSARVFCAATAQFLLDPTTAADIVNELTPGAGVTIDGALIKDGGATFSDLIADGDLTYGTDIFANVNTAAPVVSFGNSNGAGANIKGWGGAHASDPNDMQFRAGSTPWLAYDHSAGSAALTADMVMGGYLVRSLSTDSAIFSGGTAINVGANVVAYGQGHPSRANDMRFRAGDVDWLAYDHSMTTLSITPTTIFAGAVTRSGSGAGFAQVNGLSNTIFNVGTTSNAGLLTLNEADGTEFVRADALASTLTVNGSAIFAGDVDARDAFFRNSAGGRIILDDSDVLDAATPMWYTQSSSGSFAIGKANRNASGGTTGSTPWVTVDANLAAAYASNVGIGAAPVTSNAGIASYLSVTGTSAGIILDDNDAERFEIYSAGGLLKVWGESAGEDIFSMSSAGGATFGSDVDVAGSVTLATGFVSNGLLSNNDTDSLSISGSNGINKGANLLLFADLNVGNAYDWAFRADQTNRVSWDDSALTLTVAGDVGIVDTSLDAIVAYSLTNDAQTWSVRNSGANGNKFEIRDVTNGLNAFTVEPLTGRISAADGATFGGSVIVNVGSSEHLAVLRSPDFARIIIGRSETDGWDFQDASQELRIRQLIAGTPTDWLVAGTDLSATFADTVTAGGDFIAAINGGMTGQSSVGTVGVAGGAGLTVGGNVVFYAQGHATKANDTEFRAGTSVWLHHDASAGLATFSSDVSIGGQFYAGSGSPVDYYRHYFADAFTSGGGDSVVAGAAFGQSITAAAGDTAWHAAMAVGNVVGTSMTTQGATQSVGLVTSVYLAEPNITVGTGDTITAATTLYIQGAPTEGGQNYALLVDNGDVRIDDALGVGGAPSHPFHAIRNGSTVNIVAERQGVGASQALLQAGNDLVYVGALSSDPVRFGTAGVAYAELDAHKFSVGAPLTNFASPAASQTVLNVSGSTSGTSLGIIEVGGYRTALDSGRLGRITFHNHLSTDTANDKQVAAIETWSNGSDVLQGALRFYLHNASTAMELKWFMENNEFIGHGGQTIRRSINNSQLYISGGSASNVGANIVLEGGSAVDANDIEFRTGSTVRMRWDDSEARWNLNSNRFTEVASIDRGTSAGELIISAGSGITLGANIRMFGESHVSQANDFDFRTGSDVRLRWDHSQLAWNYGTNIITGVSDLRRGSPTGHFYISGGSNLNNGANIVLYSEGHATNANDIFFRANTNDVLTYDSSANGWNFRDTTLFNLGNLTLNGGSDITRSVTQDSLRIAGGNAVNDGGNILLYGSTQSTNGGDIILRSGSSVVAQWDQSAVQWDYNNTALNGVHSIIRGSGNADALSLAGGNATSAGSNFILYGGAHATSPYDILIRAGSTTRLHWDNSVPLWDFKGTDVVGFQRIFGKDATGSLVVGANRYDDTAGANIILYASGHVTNPGDIVVRNGTNTALHYQAALNNWDFSGKSVSNITEVLRGSTTDEITISGDAANNVGANIVLFGGSHATQSNDILLRSGTTNRMQWDASANRWNLNSNRLTEVASIDRGTAAGEFIVSAGSSITQGANIRMFGESHVSQAGDIQWRTGSTIVLEYDNSENRLDAKFNQIRNAVSMASTYAAQFQNDNATAPETLRLHLGNATPPNNTTAAFLKGTDVSTTRFTVWSDGSIETNGGFSFAGKFNRGSPTELTIAAAAITVTKSFHTIDTEADASTDTLSTISGGAEGDELTLMQADSLRDVTIDNSGNIRLTGGSFTFSTTNDTISFMNRAGTWRETSRSINS